VINKPSTRAAVVRDRMSVSAVYNELKIVAVPSVQTSYVRHYIHRRQGNCIIKQNEDSGWSW
jgi:hypothetical protein